MNAIRGHFKTFRCTLVVALLVATTVLLSGFDANAGRKPVADVEGWVQVTPERELYVQWFKAQPGKQTIILLNGLTYDLTYWDRLLPRLLNTGMGVVRYDPAGMGKTLERYGAVSAAIGIDEQARDIDRMTRKLGINGKLNLVGLSYGGGMAIVFGGLFPERVDQLMLAAPFTEPIPQQHQWILGQITWTRITFPFNTATDEELYAFFLRQNVYFVYPLLEPSVYDSKLKPEAVYQMTQGIREYDIKHAILSAPARTVHLLQPGKDEYIPGIVSNEFWKVVPTEARGSRMIIKGAAHKISETEPRLFTKWVVRVLDRDPALFKGETYSLWPQEGE